MPNWKLKVGKGWKEKGETTVILQTPTGTKTWHKKGRSDFGTFCFKYSFIFCIFSLIKVAKEFLSLLPTISKPSTTSPFLNSQDNIFFVTVPDGIPPQAAWHCLEYSLHQRPP